jgi:dTDP-4-dehydrorhamnose 3,5-epimerase
VKSSQQSVNSFQKIELSIPGVWELRPKVFRDARGFFMETYHQTRFAELGITDSFVQDNHSSSVKGAIRGLHYQLRHPQAKLCRVVEGEVFDVAVDIRVGSPYFGQWSSVVLSANHQNQIYIPRGFAHGYLALSDRVQFLYKCSDFYDPADERGILWNDPQINIPWNVTNPLVSEKDLRFANLSETLKESLPQYLKT